VVVCSDGAGTAQVASAAATTTVLVFSVGRFHIAGHDPHLGLFGGLLSVLGNPASRRRGFRRAHLACATIHMLHVVSVRWRNTHKTKKERKGATLLGIIQHITQCSQGSIGSGTQGHALDLKVGTRTGNQHALQQPRIGDGRENGVEVLD
jgi:hypothetical protein